MKRKLAGFGSISSGTMRAEDLIPTFAYALAQLCGKRSAHAKLVKEADALEDYESEQADDVLSDLFDALNDYAPAYGYFGAHPGDGSDYGFWLSEEFEQSIEDSGGIKVNDSAEIPRGYTGEALVVNDHGNCTLFRCIRGRRYEVWAVV